MLSALFFLLIVAFGVLAIVASIYGSIKLTKFMFVAVFNSTLGLVKAPKVIVTAIMSFCRKLKTSIGSFNSMLMEKARKVKSIMIFTSPKKPKADETPEPVLVRHEALWKEVKDWSLYDEPAWLRHGKNLAFK